MTDFQTEKIKEIKNKKNPTPLETSMVEEWDTQFKIKKQKEAMECKNLIKNPQIFDFITFQEMDKKIVGEIPARRAIFLCAQGRLVINCQTASYNVLISGTAGCGKDYVTSKVLQLIPKESYIKRTRISPTAFTYWHNSAFEPDWTWDGKVFYCEDISENVLNSDVFKVMCSEGSHATITIRQRAHDIYISGKPVNFTTTASSVPNPELTRRFIILTLDESSNQTKAILKRHAQFAKMGKSAEYSHEFIEAQELLQRVTVVVPFADVLTDYLPIENLIMRTNFPRLIDLIKASAAFHQFQRKYDELGRVIADYNDYLLAKEVFQTICSNKYMIPLTSNQKKIMECFEKDDLYGSISEVHRVINFLSLQGLKDNIDILRNYGLVQVEVEKDSWNRDIEKFKLCKNYKSSLNLELPKEIEVGIQGIIPQMCNEITQNPTCSLSEVSIVSNIPIIGRIPLIPNFICPKCGLNVEKIDWYYEENCCKLCKSSIRDSLREETPPQPDSKGETGHPTANHLPIPQEPQIPSNPHIQGKKDIQDGSGGYDSP